MKERGLCFTTELVPKVLDGTKTVTRRLGGLKEINEHPGDYVRVSEQSDYRDFWSFYDALGGSTQVKCPQGVPGDKFYLKETWGFVYSRHSIFGPPIPVYKVDYLSGTNSRDEIKGNLQEIQGKIRWKSPRFQSKWTCRPQRWEIVSVRPERVQEITAEDIIAEGYCDPQLASLPAEAVYAYRASSAFAINARAWFSALWDSINAARGYPFERNNWTFRCEWNPKPVVDGLRLANGSIISGEACPGAVRGNTTMFY